MDLTSHEGTKTTKKLFYILCAFMTLCKTNFFHTARRPRVSKPLVTAMLACVKYLL